MGGSLRHWIIALFCVAQLPAKKVYAQKASAPHAQQGFTDRRHTFVVCKTTKAYRFAPKAFTALSERDDIVFEFCDQGYGWDLFISPHQTRVTNYAMKQMRDAVQSDVAASDQKDFIKHWVQSQDPRKLWTRLKGKTKKDRYEDFALAWQSYRDRFLRELSEFQDRLQTEGWNTAAVIDLDILQLQKSLAYLGANREFQQRMELMGLEFLKNLLDHKDIEVREKTFIEVPVASAQSPLKREAALLIDGAFQVSHVADASRTRVQFKSEAVPRKNGDALVFGTLHLAMALDQLSIGVQHLTLQSEIMKEAIRVRESDRVRFNFAFDATKVARAQMSVLFNERSKAFEIRFERDDLKLSLGELASLKSVSVGDDTWWKPSEFVTAMIHQKRPWSWVSFILNDPILQGLAKNYLHSMILDALPERTLSMPLAVYESSESVSGSTQDVPSVSKKTIHVLSPKSESAKGLVKRADFLVEAPFSVAITEARIEAMGDPGNVNVRLKLDADVPHIDVAKLRFFRGERVISSDEVGLRINLGAKSLLASSGRKPLRLTASTTASFPDFGLNSNHLETNLDDFFIPQVDLRIRDQWLHGTARQSGRFSVALLTQAPMLPTIRSMFVQPRKPSHDDRSPSSLVGETLENEVIEIIRGQMTTRLSTLRTPFNETLEGYTISGVVMPPRVNPERIRFKFRDDSAQSDSRKGRYIISADLGIVMGPTLGLQFEDLKVLKGKLSLAQADKVLVQFKNKSRQNHSLSMTIDLYYHPVAHSIVVVPRHLQTTLSDISLSKLEFGEDRLFGNIPQGLLQSLASMSGMGPLILKLDPVGKAEWIVKWSLEKLLLNQGQGAGAQFLYAKTIAPLTESLDRTLHQWTLGFLESPLVQGHLSRLMSEADRYEAELASTMWTLGADIKKPVEDWVMSQAISLTADYRDTVEQKATKLFSQLDSVFDQVESSFLESLNDTVYMAARAFVSGTDNRSYLVMQLDRLFNKAESRVEVDAMAFQFSQYCERLSPDAIEAASSWSLSDAEADSLWTELRSALPPYSPMYERRLRHVFYGHCEARRQARQSYDIWNVDALKGSMNKMFLSEAFRRSQKLDVGKFPIGLANKGVLEPGLSVSGVEFKPGPEPQLRIRLASKLVGTSISDEIVDPLMQTQAGAVKVMVPRDIWNQILAEINWSELLKTSFQSVLGENDSILVMERPFIDERGNFNAFVKVKAPFLKPRLLFKPFVSALSKLFQSRSSRQQERALREAQIVESNSADAEVAAAIQSMKKIHPEHVMRVVLSIPDLLSWLSLSVNAKISMPLTLSSREGPDGDLKVDFLGIQDRVTSSSPFMAGIVSDYLDHLPRLLSALLSSRLSSFSQLPLKDVVGFEGRHVQPRFIEGHTLIGFEIF